ncbi:MAG: hypothetical protein A3E82_00755 [Gammaproteobacteria bacterium RIFCSPHIGHO2_12_FULL_38_11]|nr:MAG: hypothetical protein A3E82_00755 [Gammaproteobacteria bacterium RIFCSPHIGHO2_12_FULL_38_11]
MGPHEKNHANFPVFSDLVFLTEKPGYHRLKCLCSSSLSTAVVQCNTKALEECIEAGRDREFRWYDLRHTWASWHVQNGTSLQELQQLGGWASFEMVLRYAHLSSDHLKEAAERVYVTNSLHHASRSVEKITA